MKFPRRGVFFAAAVVVEIVSLALAPADPGVMLAGENEQLNVVGMPLQLSVTGLLNAPDCGVAVTVKLPAIPAGIVSDPGAALNDRVGVGGGGGGAGATQVAA
jgi:hypothetical protein